MMNAKVVECVKVQFVSFFFGLFVSFPCFFPLKKKMTMIIRKLIDISSCTCTPNRRIELTGAKYIWTALAKLWFLIALWIDGEIYAKEGITNCLLGVYQFEAINIDQFTLIIIWMHAAYAAYVCDLGEIDFPFENRQIKVFNLSFELSRCKHGIFCICTLYIFALHRIFNFVFIFVLLPEGY